MSMMVSFVLSFFPRDVLDEILNLIESVSEDFPSYSCMMSKYWNYFDGDGILNLWTNETLSNNVIEYNFVKVVLSYEMAVKLSNYQYDKIVFVYNQNPSSFDVDFKKPFPPIPIKEQLKRQTYRLFPPKNQ